MNEKNIRRASLSELRRMKDEGLMSPPGPGLAEELPDDFWDGAVVVEPPYIAPVSVHLNLEPEVFAFFKAQGKGHITRMQNVLKAYVKAHSR